MQPVTVTIDPENLGWLDSQAEALGETRSYVLRCVIRQAIAAEQPRFTAGERRVIRKFIGEMVDRVKGNDDAGAAYDEGIVCPHPSPYEILAGGMRRCKQCGAVQGADKEWRAKT